METSEIEGKIYVIKVCDKDVIVVGGIPLISCPALFKALAKSRDKAQKAIKDKSNKFHGYDYVSAENVISVANEALESSGLHMIELGHNTVNENGTRYLITSWILTHESGEVFPLKDTKTPIIPEKGRPEDKAQFASMTEALAYRYRSLLLVQRGGPDVSGRDDTDSEQKNSGKGSGSRNAGEDTRGRTNERSGDSGCAGNGASNASTSTGTKQETRQEVKPGTPTHSAETQSIINAMLGVFSTKAKEPDFQKDDTRMKGMQNIAKGYGFEKVGRFIMDSDVPHAIAMEMGDAGYTAAAKIISANGNKLSKAIEAGKANEILACFPKIGL